MIIQELKNITPSVFAAFERLIPQLSATAALPTIEHLRKLADAPNCHLFVAHTEGGETVGTLTLARYLMPTGERFWIEDVIVDISVRGQGVGKELTEYAIAFAKSQGAKAIELTSNPSRIAANKLYQSLGFKLRETNTYRLTF